MRITMQTRPLSDRTWLRPPSTRKPSPFSASWQSTLELLDREVIEAGGDHVVIEIGIGESDIRVDGQPKARARATTPAVRIAFKSAHGPLIYPADLYDGGPYRSQMLDWQHNVRAVALALEASRVAPRHGVGERGETYTGFRQLNAGGGAAASHMTQDEACRVLSDLSGVTITPGESEQSVRARVRTARAAAHPDRHGGDRTLWDQVEQAAAVLGVTR